MLLICLEYKFGVWYLFGSLRRSCDIDYLSSVDLLLIIICILIVVCQYGYSIFMPYLLSVDLLLIIIYILIVVCHYGYFMLCRIFYSMSYSHLSFHTPFEFSYSVRVFILAFEFSYSGSSFHTRVRVLILLSCDFWISCVDF